MIALDVSQFDHLTVGSGQYRYVMELARGLATERPQDPFLMYGSQRAPAEAVTPWQYRRMRHAAGRGAYYVDQSRYAVRLRVDRPALLHTTHTLVPWMAPCPVVVTVYDLMYELFPEYEAIVRSRAYRRYRHGVQNRAARVICISETTARDVASRWAVPRERISVVPLGTAFHSVAAAPPPAPADGRSLIVAPYNLEPRKNLDALLVAVTRVPNFQTTVQLALFGAAAVTPQRAAAFDARVTALGLGDVVLRTGRLDDAQLAGLYDRATVFAFPSLYEGFGLPVLEAMSRGACVVARRASAMADVVGDAGVLVATEDPAALGQALAALLADPARRQALGAAARVRAAACSLPRMAQATWEVYQSALAGT